MFRPSLMVASRELLARVPNTVPRAKLPRDAFSGLLKSNSNVFVHGVAATPRSLVTAMSDYGVAAKLENINVYHIHTEGAAAHTGAECFNVFRDVSLFVGANVRKQLNDGTANADYVPISLQSIPSVLFPSANNVEEFENNFDISQVGRAWKDDGAASSLPKCRAGAGAGASLELDLAVISVSPPDARGYVSLGASVDVAHSALMAAKKIVAQINSNVPRVFGDGFVHMSQFDTIVQVDEKLPELMQRANGSSHAAADKIGRLLASTLISDCATLQMGIGEIPDAVLRNLHDHRGLGIHSEMLSDGIIDLIEMGAITNEYKVTDTGKTIGGFAFGSSHLYEFIEMNPSIELRKIEYVNSLRAISANPRVVSINSAIEIDLTGQVSADSIGEAIYSGVGGQPDFVRGALASSDGRGISIIALPSTTSRGHSRIVPILQPGAGVVTLRSDVEWVATEYGLCNLKGKSLRQRAKCLIQIAHPDCRDMLEAEARKRFHFL